MKVWWETGYSHSHNISYKKILDNYKRKNSNFTVKKQHLADITLSKWSMLASSVARHTDIMYLVIWHMMKDKNTMAVVFLQTKQNKQIKNRDLCLFMKKQRFEDKPKIRDIVQNNWLVRFVSIRFIKDEGSLRDCCRLEETRRWGK